MIRLSQAEVDAHKARLAKLKVQGTVRTHILRDEEVNPAQCPAITPRKPPGPRQGANVGQAVPQASQAAKIAPEVGNQAGRASFQLPYPPSVNHYWERNRNGSVRIGKSGVAYRAEVKMRAVSLRLQSHYGPLSIQITSYPPDKRRRDLDNLWKAALDALQHAGVVEDDNQFNRLEIIRGSKQKGGSLSVKIWPEVK